MDQRDGARLGATWQTCTQADSIGRRWLGTAPANVAPAFNLGRRQCREHKANSILWCDDESVSRPVPRFLVSGWACRQFVLADGRTQIFGFLVPGDIVNLQPVSQSTALGSVVAITRVITAQFARTESLASQCDQLLSKFVAESERENQIRLHVHVVRLGCMNAAERVCHLLLELRSRLERVGLADGDNFRVPLTQEVLAEALGLSVVHLNRTLKTLRLDGVLSCAAGIVRIMDPERAIILGQGVATVV